MRFSLVLAAFLCFTTWKCVVHATHGPVASCCLRLSNTRVKFENIVDYINQSEGSCPIAAVVFKTKLGKRVCSDPNSARTKDIILKLDAAKERVLQEKRQKEEEGWISKLESAAITNAPSIQPSTGCSAFTVTTGLGTVTEGQGTVTRPLGTVTGGQGTVTGGKGTVTGGLGTVTGGLGTVTGGLGTVTGGLGTVTGGLGTVKRGLVTVTGGLAPVKNRVGTVTRGPGMVTGRVGTVTLGLRTVAGGLGTAITKLGMSPVDIGREAGYNRERKTNPSTKRRFRRRRGQRTRCRAGKKGQPKRL